MYHTARLPEYFQATFFNRFIINRLTLSAIKQLSETQIMTFTPLIRSAAWLLAASLTWPIYARQPTPFSLHNGDLIFQEACQDGMGDAIKATTTGRDGYEFTHVGMVWIPADKHVRIIEATEPKVTVTPLADYLHPRNQCTPRSVVGRLKAPYRPLIPQAIRFARQKIGKPYDNAFDIHNDQYYCSELIYQVFKEANHGQPVFPLTAMTFKSKETGTFPAYWVKHFQQLHLPIPEGQPGNNPSDMSRSGLIDIVHDYQHKP